MRNLFLLLLMANLVFAMWWLWVEPTDRPAAPAPAADASAPRLLLVSEVDAMLAGKTEAREVAGLALAAPEPIVVDDAVGAGAVPGAEPVAATEPGSDAESARGDSGATAGTASPDDTPPAVDATGGDDDTGSAPGPGEASGAVTVAAATPAAAPAVPGRCVSLGPFADLAEATVAASSLRSRGLQPRQRLAESRVLAGYWVHLPAYPSRAAAVAAVEGLRENGVTDIYIEPSGEQRNAISLGIYSDRARAESHAGTIRALDFDAMVSERFRPAQAYWLDVELRPDVAVDPSSLSSSATTSLRVEDAACPAR